MQPTIGRIVIYKSKTGDYVMPAIIAATTATLHRPNVEAGHIPDLDSDTHVHLIVFTTGIPGEVSTNTAEQRPELVMPDRVNRPFGGTFQEWNIPQSQAAENVEHDAGSWFWPPRV
jgi:hypothetical protein